MMARRRRTRSRWTFDGNGAVLCALAILIAGFACHELMEYWTLSALLDRGEEVQARTTGMERKMGRHATDIISYEFTPNESDEPLTGEDRFSLLGARTNVPVNEYLKLHSRKLKVRYLPANPSVNRLNVGLEHRKSRRGLWSFGTIVLALGFAGWGLRRCRR